MRLSLSRKRLLQTLYSTIKNGDVGWVWMLYDAGKDSHLNIEGLMMAVYKLSTRIRSNVPTDSLLYDLCIYRMDSSRNKYCLIDVKQQPFSGTYETQTHMTGNVDESLSTIYIMEMNLYRKTMLHTVCVTPFHSLKCTHLKPLHQATPGLR